MHVGDLTLPEVTPEDFQNNRKQVYKSLKAVQAEICSIRNCIAKTVTKKEARSCRVGEGKASRSGAIKGSHINDCTHHLTRRNIMIQSI